jgi:hypothetical protein
MADYKPEYHLAPPHRWNVHLGRSGAYHYVRECCPNPWSPGRLLYRIIVTPKYGIEHWPLPVLSKEHLQAIYGDTVRSAEMPRRKASWWEWWRDD